MFGNSWYNASIKNYISLFGALMNDISIQRIDKNGNIIDGQTIKVPISFGPKAKWLVRLVQDPNAGATVNDGSPVQKQVEIVLPRMGFDLHPLRYDPTRKLPNVNQSVAKTGTPPSNNSLNQVLSPVAYIFPFELTVATKNKEDMFQIVEQIIPWFSPTFTVTANETNLPLKKDITICITSPVTPEFFAYGDFKESKVMLCTLNFDLYGWYSLVKSPISSKMPFMISNSSFFP